MSESTPDTPASSEFCFIFGHVGLWGGGFVALLSLVGGKPEAVIFGISAMSSSLPLFAIAAHLRQQAITNYYLGKIALGTKQAPINDQIEKSADKS